MSKLCIYLTCAELGQNDVSLCAQGLCGGAIVLLADKKTTYFHSTHRDLAVVSAVAFVFIPAVILPIYALDAPMPFYEQMVMPIGVILNLTTAILGIIHFVGDFAKRIPTLILSGVNIAAAIAFIGDWVIMYGKKGEFADEEELSLFG